MLLSFTFLNGWSQTYHFPSTFKAFNKTTNFGTVHGYLDVVNDSGDTVPMRWVSKRGASCPAPWYINFDDQNNYHAPVLDGDSADFDLHPPGTFNQKMIIGLAHNGATGSGSVFFNVFPLDDRSDSTQIEYYFVITPGTIDTSDTNGNPPDTTDTASFIADIDFAKFAHIAWGEELVITLERSLETLRLIHLNGQVIYERHHMSPRQVLVIDPKTSALIIEVHTEDGRQFWKKIGKG